MRKILLSTLLSLLLPMAATAYDAQINGIYYNLSGDEAEVTQGDEDDCDDDGYTYYSGIVVIPASVTANNGKTYAVTSIGEGAFSSCYGLTEVTIPGSVTSIGDCAFIYCYGLTEVTIPNSVTNIGDGAFYECSGLTEVTIPNSVASLGDGSFSDCENLTKVTIESNALMSPIIEEDDESSYTYYRQMAGIFGGQVKTYILGDDITIIGDEAFYGCEGLTSIIIPNSVTSIGNCAFYDCSSLNDVTIPNNVTSIGDNAFSNCKSLTSITIPEGVTSIGDGAFSDCENLTKVTIESNALMSPIIEEDDDEGSYTYYRNMADIFGSQVETYILGDAITCIGDYAFSYCENLTSINIPNSVTSIGYYAFWGCSGLTSIKVEEENITYDSRDNCNAIIETATNTLIAGCQNTIIPNTVTSIGESAFSLCYGLTEVTIPESVTSISDGAFSDCENLTKVTIESNALMSPIIEEDDDEGSYTYYRNMADIFGSQVETYILGDAITCIGDYAFSYCENLTSINIPNSVTSIGESAFEDCSSLTKVTIESNALMSPITEEDDEGSYTYYRQMAYIFGSQVETYILGDAITSIGDYAFSNCENLTSIDIPNGVTSIGESAFSWCYDLTSINIPNSVTSIGESAFCGCSSLKAITIPEGVTSIENGALYGCSSLKAITIPEGVTSIGDYAFYGCSGLKAITIPEGVTSIGDAAFCDCENLTKVTIESNAVMSPIIEEDDEGSYTYYRQMAYIFGRQVETYILGDAITCISDYAFSYCENLTSIDIPNSVTSIGESAFDGCSGLTSISIGNGVTSIGIYAFNGCDKLPYNEYKKALYLGNDENPYVVLVRTKSTDIKACNINTQCKVICYLAFEGCSGLTSVNIPNGVTSIGDGAFGGCYDLTSVTIPGSVTSIGNSAFYGCSSLTSVNIPNGVTTIGDYAFIECSGLASVNIPNGVTSIGDKAFSRCYFLSTVTIGSGMTSIGEDAFEHCNNIEKVIVPNISAWYNIKFGNAEANPLFYAHHLYSNESTEITELVIPSDVTGIGNYAFIGCSNLTSVTIPESVMTIGEDAFLGCESLTSVTLESNALVSKSREDCTMKSVFGGQVETYVLGDAVMSIGNYAFSGCEGLSSVTIGNGVTSIGNYAFYGCSSLTSVSIPENVTKIGDYAFYEEWGELNTVYCYAEDVPETGLNVFHSSSLYDATLYVPEGSIDKYKATLPWSDFGSIVSIESYVCIDGIYYSLGDEAEVIEGPGEWRYINEYDEELYVGYYTGDIVIPETVTYKDKTYNVTSISKGAFEVCRWLTSVTIPSSVTIIDDYTFYGCSGLTSVTIPNSVDSIGSQAFYGCRSLTSITIPDGVTSIPETAFYECRSLKSLVIPNNVISVGEAAFEFCTGLKEVTIGSGVKSLANTFETCTNITTLNINCEDIPAFFFADSHRKLQTLTLGDNVKTIGLHAFEGCSGLTSLTIPNSVTSIGIGAFEGCCGLTSLTIPNSVTSIGDDAFAGCENLTTVTIESDVIMSAVEWEEDGEIYYDYTWMPSIFGEQVETYYIGNGVNKIGYGAFSGCSMTSVTIGNSVTNIGEYAFDSCESLTDVYCYATEPPSAYYHDEEYDEDYYAFDIEHIKENTTLHVPEGSVELYKETKPWCWFKNMAALTDADPDPNGPDAIESTKAEEAVTEVARYDIQGRRLTASQTQGSTNAKGINIIRYSDGTTRKVLVK